MAESKVSKINKLLEEYAEGYQVYRMVFFELEDIDAEVSEFLERNEYLIETDYGTTELSKDDFERALAELENLPDEKRKKSDDTIISKEEIIYGLGGIAKLFQANKLDLALRVGF